MVAESPVLPGAEIAPRECNHFANTPARKDTRLAQRKFSNVTRDGEGGGIFSVPPEHREPSFSVPVSACRAKSAVKYSDKSLDLTQWHSRRRGVFLLL
jgi:hypothetical protein